MGVIDSFLPAIVWPGNSFPHLRRDQAQTQISLAIHQIPNWKLIRR